MRNIQLIFVFWIHSYKPVWDALSKISSDVLLKLLIFFFVTNIIFFTLILTILFSCSNNLPIHFQINDFETPLFLLFQFWCTTDNGSWKLLAMKLCLQAGTTIRAVLPKCHKKVLRSCHMCYLIIVFHCQLIHCIIIQMDLVYAKQ